MAYLLSEFLSDVSNVRLADSLELFVILGKSVGFLGVFIIPDFLGNFGCTGFVDFLDEGLVSETLYPLEHRGDFGVHLAGLTTVTSLGI